MKKTQPDPTSANDTVSLPPTDRDLGDDEKTEAERQPLSPQETCELPPVADTQASHAIGPGPAPSVGVTLEESGGAL